MSIFIAIIVIVLVLLGIIGVFLPFLPGVPLILLAAVVYGSAYGFHQIGTGIYIALAALTILSLVVDYLAVSLGARGLGASRAGVLGAVLGALVGFALSGFPGIMAGPFLGAFLAESLWGRGCKGSFRAGLGATVGILGGMVVRLLLALAMTALLVYGIVA